VADLFVALIHHPVLDRKGRIVTSAITSLDLHDMARSARTYGVRRFFVVHPVRVQRDFALSVLDHWKLGYGRQHDARRREALELIEVVADLDEAIGTSEQLAGKRPLLIYTSARAEQGASYDAVRAWIEVKDGPPLMLLFGTGFGLAPEICKRVDLVLAPIRGVNNYNHLSVRAATGIILDRLRGR
jgi:hypothetical protein